MISFDAFKLILKSKIFKISSNSRYINDVDPNIYSILISQGQYEIRSEVSEETLEGFINHWITQELPNINSNNIFEYKKLSNEFDRMKDIVNLFMKQTTKLGISRLKAYKSKLKFKLSEKEKKLSNKSANYKKTIQFLFRKHDINNYTKFLDNKKHLYAACKKNDYDNVASITAKKLNENGLIIELNEEDKTASISAVDDFSDIFIPKVVKYKNDEFIVNRLSKKLRMNVESIQFDPNCCIQSIENKIFSFSLIKSIIIPINVIQIDEFVFEFCEDLKEVTFSEGSKLKSIGRFAFMNSGIKKLSIPSSIEEFTEGWCSNTVNLNEINVIQHQIKNIKFIDDKFLIGKTDLKSDKFDVLLFARRDIEKVIIPSFITKIESYAFDKCTNLKSIEFSENSQLESIGANAFNGTQIDILYLPEKVVQLENGWCNGTSFTNFEIDKNNKNFIFYDKKYLLGKSNPKSGIFDIILYANCSLREFVIPSFITKISSFSFQVRDEMTIEFCEDSQLELIDDNAFEEANIKTIKIPSKTTRIGEYAFFECKIQNIEFPENSQLTIIDNYSFYNSLIERISIPNHVVYIGRSAFERCTKMISIEFSENSELKIIDNLAFKNTNIRSLSIPSSVIYIGKRSFECNLEEINFSVNSKLKTIEKFAFCGSNSQKVQIPSSVTKIKKGAFLSNECVDITLPTNKEYNKIKSKTFCACSFESISIPSQIIKIGKNAFESCRYLQKIIFSEDSELRIIDSAFSDSSLQTFFISSKVVELKDGWCERTLKLNNIKISEKNHNFLYYQEKILLGKSVTKSDVFDILLFANRNIENVVIPSFVKKIASYSFHMCRNLQKVEFLKDSKLEIIEKDSFAFTDLKSIMIPQHVKFIGEYTFCCCENLKDVILMQILN